MALINRMLVVFAFGFLSVTVALPAGAIDFFKTRDSSVQFFSTPRSQELARVIFFLSPGCVGCLELVRGVDSELKKLGYRYQASGVFVGRPEELGNYFQQLQQRGDLDGGYPFGFEISLDTNRQITRPYRITGLPSAVVEAGGNRVVISRSAELREKLR